MNELNAIKINGIRIGANDLNAEGRVPYLALSSSYEPPSSRFVSNGTGSFGPAINA